MATTLAYQPRPPPPPTHHQDIRFIPVSVSKTARAYFNIARKALETHRRVELSALEAAVVIAVDASFLLTRAKMGTVERVNTAFVQVPSHQPGYPGHMRKARIQIVLRKTPEFDAYMRANPRPPRPVMQPPPPTTTTTTATTTG